jgi:hypothetical protein
MDYADTLEIVLCETLKLRAISQVGSPITPLPGTCY